MFRKTIVFLDLAQIYPRLSKSNIYPKFLITKKNNVNISDGVKDFPIEIQHQATTVHLGI